MILYYYDVSIWKAVTFVLLPSWSGRSVFNSTRSTDLNRTRKTETEFELFYKNIRMGLMSLLGYNPNRTEIQIRIWRYPKISEIS